MQLEVSAGRCRSSSAVLSLLVVLGFAGRAGAQDDRAGSSEPVTAQRSAGAGAFSNWNQPARNDGQRASAHVAGGYDGASKGATFDSAAAARIQERLSVRASGSSSPASPGLALRFEGKLDALRQENSGVDLAFAGGYESRGFNDVPAVTAGLALGRSVGKLQLLANMGYSRGLEASEQYGSAGLAGIYPVSERVQLGLDSRLRIDLERDDDEPVGEREWELLAGPTITVTAGSFAVIAGAGVAANQLRLLPALNVGAIGYLGLGAAF